MMRLCLELALQGGDVGNGARVGAVLARGNEVLATGVHRGFGLPHAEAELLAGYTGTIQPGDTLYVSLEPCCHQGKTPPCTDVILRSGVRRVVYGMQDPDARVAGKGIHLLREAGIEVVGPVERAPAEWVNRGFMSVRTQGRPWITIKQALSLDGSVAETDGSFKKITSPVQDTWSHTRLRATHDAILTGVGTIIRDNPRLNTRLASPVSPRIPYRIVLDAALSIPLESRVVTDDHRDRTMIVTAPAAASSPAADRLRAQGVRLLVIPLNDHGLFTWENLWSAFLTPVSDFDGLTSILVEGGPKTWEIFRSAGMVDAVVTLRGA